MATRRTFDQRGDFEATAAAVQFLTERGFSVGRMQRGAPRGILFGDYDIQKWRNLNRAERAMLHGEMTGDGRNGPITVELRDDAPAEANQALVGTAEENETTNAYVSDNGQFGVGA